MRTSTKWALGAGAVVVGILVGVGVYEEKKSKPAAGNTGVVNRGTGPQNIVLTSNSTSKSVPGKTPQSTIVATTYSARARAGGQLYITFPSKLDALDGAIQVDPGLVTAAKLIALPPVVAAYVLTGSAGKIVLTWWNNAGAFPVLNQATVVVS